jgi:signal transduction histidine kinase
MKPTHSSSIEGALEQLKSESSRERLRAARYLERNAQMSDLASLTHARRIETYSYVIASLERGISRLKKIAPERQEEPEDEYEIPDDVRLQIKSRATEWITGLLLHELSGHVGLIRSAAAAEIESYETSTTKKRLNSLDSIFTGIKQLKGATATPKPEQFDLSELISELTLEVAEAVKETERTIRIDYSLVGAKPTIITSDQNLIRLFLGNGIRNAFEAVRSLQAPVHNPIVVSWGITDVDYWVSIVDQGPGIVGSGDAAFDIGTSTKKRQGHTGFGLAIARQAVETLGGEVTLTPATQGGAKYEARWKI